MIFFYHKQQFPIPRRRKHVSGTATRVKPWHEVLAAAMYLATGNPVFGSVEDVRSTFPDMKWRVSDAVNPDGSTGKIAFAVIGGNRDTGNIHVLAVLENAAAPAHTHEPATVADPYGELIITIAGVLEDRRDDGTPVSLGPCMTLVHGPNTTHRPHARFWFGYFDQPCGSKLLGA